MYIFLRYFSLLVRTVPAPAPLRRGPRDRVRPVHAVPPLLRVPLLRSLPAAAVHLLRAAPENVRDEPLVRVEQAQRRGRVRTRGHSTEGRRQGQGDGGRGAQRAL